MREGLDRLMLDVPVHHLYTQLEAGVATGAGMYARAEAGAHLSKSVGVYGYGQWTPSGSSAGVGARYVYDW